MKTIRFGIIGGGLMGKEFAVAAARWAQLVDPPARPEIVALASGSEKSFGWFKSNFPSITQYTTDYRQLLANKDVDAVYIALPNDMHADYTVRAARARVNVLCEKPIATHSRDAERMIAAGARDILERAEAGS